MGAHGVAGYLGQHLIRCFAELKGNTTVAGTDDVVDVVERDFRFLQQFAEHGFCGLLSLEAGWHDRRKSSPPCSRTPLPLREPILIPTTVASGRWFSRSP
ncbi:MAG: hypothetical protein WCP20_13015 [Desulfuromonadales bacterium]